ncbi:hypothetical protein C8Q76DRAFT_797292 [Earliella scabrosa]|nr:hypothetical protein C8Q76DRAFT_797292 [Earliella scabrosa]
MARPNQPWSRGTRGRGSGGPGSPGRFGQAQQLQAQNQARNRVYEPGKRQMELIASVSRSSGLEKDGDALRDPKIQEEYRAYIQDKVDEYWKKYPFLSPCRSGASEDAESRRNRKEMEENLLILFRKLREGLLSTQRRDAFALEVYETSLHLSILFKSPAQTTSTLSHLLPDLYISKRNSGGGSTSQHLSPENPRRTPSAASSPSPVLPAHCSQIQGRPEEPSPPAAAAAIPRTALATTLISLLHRLVQAYPSQSAFDAELRRLHPALQHLLRAPPPDSPGSTPPSIPAPSPHPSLSQPSRSLPASGERPSRDSTDHARTAHPHAHDSGPELQSTPASESQLVQSIAPVVLPCSTAYDWLLDLARCLRARNYARLEGLTRRAAYRHFVYGPLSSPARAGPALSPTHAAREGSERDKQGGEARRGAQYNSEPIRAARGGQDHVHDQGRVDDPGRDSESDAPRDLALEALGTLVEALLEKARGTTWDVLRTAYREVSLRATLNPGTGTNTTETTAHWLARSLVLRPARGVEARGESKVVIDGSVGKVGRPADVEVEVDAVDAWLEERRGRGEARRKEGEGMEGRWVLVKA